MRELRTVLHTEQDCPGVTAILQTSSFIDTNISLTLIDTNMFRRFSSPICRAHAIYSNPRYENTTSPLFLSYFSHTGSEEKLFGNRGLNYHDPSGQLEMLITIGAWRLLMAIGTSHSFTHNLSEKKDPIQLPKKQLAPQEITFLIQVSTTGRSV